MPIYEYYCPECGQTFDALRPMGDADKIISCIYCQSQKTHRKLSVFFAHSNGKSITKQKAGCDGCSGATCSSCGH